MANVDLSGEQITVIPSKAVGAMAGCEPTQDQCVSMIHLCFDFRTEADAYLGSSILHLADSSMSPAAWETAKALVQDPAKTPEDLVNILVGTDWGRAMIAQKWRLGQYIQIEGK